MPGPVVGTGASAKARESLCLSSPRAGKGEGWKALTFWCDAGQVGRGMGALGHAAEIPPMGG